MCLHAEQSYLIFCLCFFFLDLFWVELQLKSEKTNKQKHFYKSTFFFLTTYVIILNIVHPSIGQSNYASETNALLHLSDISGGR